MSKASDHSSGGACIANILGPVLDGLSACANCRRSATMALVAIEIARIPEDERAQALAAFVEMLPAQVEMVAAEYELDAAHAAGRKPS